MNRLVSFGAFLLLPATLLGATAAPTAQAPASGQDLTVYSGYGRGPTQAVVEEYFPKAIRVVEGTTVTWVQETPREHTVTFVPIGPPPAENIPQPEDPTGPQMRNPLAEFPTLPDGPYDGSTFINSGRMEGGESFSVTFSTAGTFTYVCIPHLRDDMRGTVEVVPAGSAGITMQEDIERETAAAYARFKEQTDQILANRSEPSSFDRPDGTRDWFVRAGTDVRSEPDLRVGRLTIRQFLPDRLTIQQGDTVIWYTDTRVPVHNVLFPAPGTQVSSGYVPQSTDGILLPLEMLTERGTYRGDPNSMDWPRLIEDLSAQRPSRP
ncbi:MAG: hypothetical protein HW416_2375, partial [Chloroflexi bacterium]|nr:hypothetical protein [Chloroflexota bacterium]